MGPLGSLPGNRIEVIERGETAACPVVVAAHVQAVQLFQTDNGFVWRRTVTNHVAQVPDNVMLRRSRQHSGQRLHVGVDVRKNESTHERSLGAGLL